MLKTRSYPVYANTSASAFKIKNVRYVALPQKIPKVLQMAVDRGGLQKILKYLEQVNVKYLETRIQPNIDRTPLDPPILWASGEYLYLCLGHFLTIKVGPVHYFFLNIFNPVIFPPEWVGATLVQWQHLSQWVPVSLQWVP